MVFDVLFRCFSWCIHLEDAEMTRKDYVLLAAAIERAGLSGDFEKSEYQAAIEYVATELADALAAENPRFERDRFLKACGVI
jgi:hypothetical protein